jgi:hypothetical protein
MRSWRSERMSWIPEESIKGLGNVGLPAFCGSPATVELGIELGLVS